MEIKPPTAGEGNAAHVALTAPVPTRVGSRAGSPASRGTSLIQVMPLPDFGYEARFTVTRMG